MVCFRWAVMLALMGATLSGCAVMEEKNRVLLKGLDNAAAGSFLTETKTARVAAAPLAIPVGVGAAAVDMAILIPANQVVPSYRDTKQLVWENPEGSDFRQAVLFLPKVVATPLVYTGSWAMRSFFFGDN